jgi:hypothetical protein
VSAWEELRGTGAFGQEATIELYRCVRAVARAGNYPPPEGHHKWTVDAVVETAHDVFADARGPQRLVELAVKASDDASFLRLLEQVTRNYLRDQARLTAKGRLIRRLRELLEADTRFTVVPNGQPGAGNVELADGTTPGVWNGRLSDLTAAAYKVTDVSIVRWRPQARRQSPVADAPSLLAVCESVLRAAGASLPVAEIADAVAARFAVARGPVVIPVDDIELWSLPTVMTDDPSAEAEVRAGAEQLISQLTSQERIVLAYLDNPVRQIADRTGLGKSTAAEVASHVRQIAARVLGGEEQREAMFTLARVLVTPASSGRPVPGEER